ncbi:acyl carrier protein [Bacillus atrophaeus]|uniref:Acyl carrier protein n=1 Tax=Bacillus atrophaeus (strain 1942) TaxID=720555 RepID=A0ABN3ZBR6_BACA1|nr:acyl carrier protein [Bacillus atrophaeus]AMR64737.1 poly(3-hydroxyalkanoate) depolymerase [Bacillus subtilis subsp. globigii]ADP32228.1 acyl carrier protein [Bacillus atrophaeus 1942]AIK45572.1 polyketide biosynthesis acyl-carrier-protein AcpK [Bacillus atrophaeus subsp. globigii]EIM08811.1 acyl carrier protein [Bacillus atrophaeus C89]KFK82127.1 polyketide biosynthesis acyl-carrier-protein AcpK [Bacillus atrophaeus]
MNKQRIFEVLVTNICEVLPELDGHRFEPDDRLVELGADSVDRAEIITMVLEELSLNIPRVELSGVKNIGELTEVLYEKVQSV